MFPEEWAKGVLVPIPKGGSLSSLDTGNYRGITMLNILPKIYTSIIHERLKQFCETEKVLAEEQAGFREGRSTIDQIFILHEVTKGRFPNKTYCCFLDIKKAYDRVWRDGLWYKLNGKGIQGKIWRVIRNMYAKVEVCVQINENLSEFFDILSGLRQGCLLSPCYLIFLLMGS